MGFFWVIGLQFFKALRNLRRRGIIPLPMTSNQEEALFDFLDNTAGTFELNDVVSYIKMVQTGVEHRLPFEIEAYVNVRNLAFPLGKDRWLSRRGCFESLSFVISPTRLELVNGILIPGHRCLPFANANLLPHEYIFFWQGSQVPFTSIEGPPEEFYPYYNLFGEEYAPQYVARDNSENEMAFNSDPYDDPPEVSIKTLDMRNIYREASFVPGDRFIVTTRDWREGSFELKKAGKDEWAQADLDAWFSAAESGFEESFAKLGPGTSTEEQISYAYWYGGSRMREIPAYSLEEYLYDKTNKIEISGFGIESRFWYAGREIPDLKALDTSHTRPDKTPIEEMLSELHIPVSEYVIQSYVRDSFFREEKDAELIGKRLIPGVELGDPEKKFLSGFLNNLIEEFRDAYNRFTDRTMGPIRQRAGELHTAVIELSARLSKGDIDISWLPRHTFIILSQIQSHTASVMEDLDSDIPPEAGELEALDGSLDSMIETYEDVKELIDEALDIFRHNKLAVIRPGDNVNIIAERLIQASVGGIDVWRRLIIPDSCTLRELHWIMLTVFRWPSLEDFRFTTGAASMGKDLFSGLIDLDRSIRELEAEGIVELLFEYGANWTVKVIILARQDAPEGRPIRCVAGAGAAPPEFIDGPVKYKRLLSYLESGNEIERINARNGLGPNFDPDEFDLEACNRLLAAMIMARDANKI